MLKILSKDVITCIIFAMRFMDLMNTYNISDLCVGNTQFVHDGSGFRLLFSL